MHISTQRSIYEGTVTHTGQPGPDTSRSFGDIKDRMPFLKIAAVCVPQTSMMRSLGPS